MPTRVGDCVKKIKGHSFHGVLRAITVRRMGPVPWYTVESTVYPGLTLDLLEDELTPCPKEEMPVVISRADLQTLLKINVSYARDWGLAFPSKEQISAAVEGAEQALKQLD